MLALGRKPVADNLDDGCQLAGSNQRVGLLPAVAPLGVRSPEVVLHTKWTRSRIQAVA
jgi:hypothetical protein